MTNFVDDDDILINPGHPPALNSFFVEEDLGFMDMYYSCNFSSGVYSLAPWVVISGIVTIEGSPASRKVWLLEWFNKQVVRTTWSDPLTGIYSFNDIKSGNYFTWSDDFQNIFHPLSTAKITI